MNISEAIADFCSTSQKKLQHLETRVIKNTQEILNALPLQREDHQASQTILVNLFNDLKTQHSIQLNKTQEILDLFDLRQDSKTQINNKLDEIATATKNSTKETKSNQEKVIKLISAIESTMKEFQTKSFLQKQEIQNYLVQL